MNLYTVKSNDPALNDINISSNSKEKEYIDHLAEIYGIFLTTEELEKAYVGDFVSADEYSTVCSKLIGQYKTALNFLGSSFSIDYFLRENNVHFPAAYRRLVSVGVPATVEHATISSGAPDGAASSIYIAKTVELFITTMDSLKLGICTVEQLHPLLSELTDTMNRLPMITNSLDIKTKLCHYLIRINSMKVSDELQPEEIRQLNFDLETGLSDFYRVLNKK